MLDLHEIERILDLSLCPRCCALFVDPKNYELLILSEDDLINKLKKKILFKYNTEDIKLKLDKRWKDIDIMDINDEINNGNNNIICPCCYGSLMGDNPFNVLVESIKLQLKAFSDNIDYDISKSPLTISFTITLPPVFDLARITARLIICKTLDKSLAIPSFEELFIRILTILLSKEYDIKENKNHSKVIITIEYDVDNESELCFVLNEKFHHKNKRKKFGAVDANIDRYEISNGDVDNIIGSYKKYNLNDIDNVLLKIIEFNNNNTAAFPIIKCKAIPTSFFLLGRYRKHARDVPQAPWTIGDERKGRSSVEEIITESVKKALNAKHCRMHPCGREDIDVRCLGNGRPFVMEVIEPYSLPNVDNLQKACEFVGTKEGLNTEGDVELVMLTNAKPSLWETMQTIAEEKKKGYRCVVWSANKVTREQLNNLEMISRNINTPDCDGRPSLEILQKTPLRVLHRRSLLDRKRHIYDIETALINDHFFLLSIVTSAGTYVKEFVHGDLGRTVPSMCSLLQCQCDILQLDVTWLYDEFPGGGEPPASINIDDVSNSNYIGWNDMKLLSIPSLKSKNNNLIENNKEIL